MVAHDAYQPAFDTLNVFHAARQFRMNLEGNFWDLGAQYESSLESPVNMRTSVDEVLRKLNADPQMVQQFRAAYGRAPDRTSFLDALATFERSLLTPASRFDRWLGGEASALSPGELAGYQLFKSLGCSSCHQGVNVGGDVFTARAGTLRNYDPLVREINELHESLSRLRETAAIDSETTAALDQLVASVDQQEELVERFKSDNALLHNSLAVFGRFSVRPVSSDLGPTISAAAAAMLHLTLDTSSAAARDVQDRLDELGNRARSSADT